jgi:hypothetical protein
MLGAVETLKLLAVNGQILPGVLRLDQRSIKRPDEPVKRFVVPMLDFDVTPLLGGAPTITAPPPLTPVPAKAAPPNIAEQMAAVESIESSRKRAAEIKPTGVAVKTAAERNTLKQQPTVRSPGRNPEPSPDPFDAAENDIAVNDDPEAGQGATPNGLFDPGPAQQPQINQRQLGIIGHLFNAIGMQTGDKPRLDWCARALNRELTSPAELSEAEAITLISKLTELLRIRKHYDTDDMNVVLDDLTEYLQLEHRLERIELLSDDDIAACIEAIEMGEQTGRQILGLRGVGDEATPETETG